MMKRKKKLFLFRSPSALAELEEQRGAVLPGWKQASRELTVPKFTLTPPGLRKRGSRPAPAPAEGRCNTHNPPAGARSAFFRRYCPAQVRRALLRGDGANSP